VTEAAVLLTVATLAVGLAVGFAIRLLPSVRLQVAGLALLAVVLPLVAVLTSGWVMFHMHDDAKILTVASACALSAVVAALLLARWIIAPLERLRETSAAVAAGDLSARAPARGPSEIAELGASFNEMARSIEQLFDARRQLVAWASHDLRAPLASMTAMVEAIEDDLAEPGEYLPALRSQLRLLAGLVDDLFELARIDAGALSLELLETQLEEIVDSCVRGLDAEARSRGVYLHAELEQPLPRVRCAPDKVERVLFNLLTNALRHTPSDGTVAVRVRGRDHTVVVEVEDDGAGLTEEATARMFERFWRADGSRGASGSGLGLAIARGLIEAQDGQIWAENRYEGGARVAFALPAASPP
jgi:signal transduction histidine kinase